MRRVWLLIILACWLGGTVAAQAADAYYMMLGSMVVELDHPPVIDRGGEVYLTLGLLDKLALPREELDASTPAPPDDAQQSGDSSVEIVSAPEGDTIGTGPHARYLLGGTAVEVDSRGSQPAVTVNGTALPSAAVTRYSGHGYLSEAEFEKLGLRLEFNTLENLYQVIGLVHRIGYTSGASELTISCLTPVQAHGIQVDDNRLTMVIEGGYTGAEAPREYGADSPVTKLGFKSQPELGRSFVFIHQPRRTGFKVQSDPEVGFARVKFGNYFQVASFQQSSSGDLSVAVQLGAPSELHHELIDNPPRLVVDFPGATYEDATKTIPVGIGSVEQIRVGTPVPGTVRVVLDLERRVDYRLLSNDEGARHYIQLLPPVVPAATAVQRRVGRTIMIDPGHGGSDPGAEGVLPDTWEATLNLQICNYLEQELKDLGYDVLTTRRADRFVSLGARADYANNVLPYIFVSVHCNSLEDPDYQGLMTFHHPSSTQGPLLARLVHEECLAATGAVDKNVREANFFVLRETVMPSVLVECGCLTNREECGKLVTPTYQQRIAAAIARGVDRYVTGGS